MSDTQRWAVATNEQMELIAKKWAKKYSTKKLRGFQAYYVTLCKKVDSELEYKCYDNMWNTVTRAISIRNFGV